jgi:hypothetical protein
LALEYIPGEFTGIYEDLHWSANDPESIKKLLQAMSFDIFGVFNQVEQLALKKFSVNCTHSDWFKSLPDEAEPIAKDARDVLFQVKSARHFFEQSDPKSAAFCVFMMGRAFERMLVRKLEPNAMRGHNALQGARKGQAEVFGTREQNEREWAKWQTEVDRVAAEKPVLSHRAIARTVAATFRVSQRSILRRTRKRKTGAPSHHNDVKKK